VQLNLTTKMSKYKEYQKLIKGMDDKTKAIIIAKALGLEKLE